MSALDQFLDQSARDLFPAAVVHVREGGKVVYERAVGWLDLEHGLCPQGAAPYRNGAGKVPLPAVNSRTFDKFRLKK